MERAWSSLGGAHGDAGRNRRRVQFSRPVLQGPPICDSHSTVTRLRMIAGKSADLPRIGRGPPVVRFHHGIYYGREVNIDDFCASYADRLRAVGGLGERDSPLILACSVAVAVRRWIARRTDRTTVTIRRCRAAPPRLPWIAGSSKPAQASNCLDELTQAPASLVAVELSDATRNGALELIRTIAERYPISQGGRSGRAQPASLRMAGAGARRRPFYRVAQAVGLRLRQSPARHWTSTGAPRTRSTRPRDVASRISGEASPGADAFRRSVVVREVYQSHD